MIIEESKHEAAEQQYFWPAVKRLGPDGARVAELGLEQEAEAVPVLAELDKLQPADEGFEERLVAFTAAARAHITYEEAHAWPLLRASISADEAQPWATRSPGPRSWPRPGRTRTSLPSQARRRGRGRGPVAGVADRLRDSVTGRGKPPRKGGRARPPVSRKPRIEARPKAGERDER